MAAKKPIHFGWLIAMVCFFMMALQFCPSLNLQGLFVNPMAESFGVNRTSIVTMSTIMILSSVLSTLVSGTLLSRYNMRLIIVLMLVLGAAAFLVQANTTNLTILYVMAALRGISNSFISVIPISILMTNWFAPNTRGKAMSIAMIGSGVGSTILNPVVGYIIENLSWRNAYTMFAIFNLIMVPVIWFVVRRTPQDFGMIPVGHQPGTTPASAMAVYGFTVKQALVSPIFWMVVLSFFALNGIAQAWLVNGPSFLDGLGFTPVTASSIFSVNAVGIVIGKLVLGVVNDRFGSRTGVILGMSVMTAANAILIFLGFHLVAAMVCSFIVGLGIAACTMSMPLGVSDLFGNRSYGTLMSYVSVGGNLGSSLIPLGLAFIIETTNSYTLSWGLAAGIGAMALTLISLAYHNKIKVDKAQITTEQVSSR